MRVTITQEYYRPYSVVNSVWAAARHGGFVPDIVYLLVRDSASGLAEKTAAMLGAAMSRFGGERKVVVTRVDLDDPKAARELAARLTREHKDKGDEVAIDVTPGRTLPKLALYHAALAKPAPDHVFYLDVEGYRYADRPYVAVPFRFQKIRDLLKEVKT